jgi:hypothetical protein
LPTDNIITVREGESIFDIASRYYGGVQGSVALMLENPIVEDLNENIVGFELVVANPIATSTVISVASPAPVDSSSIVITVREGETIFDIASRYYSDVSSAISIMISNDISNLSSNIIGDEIVINDQVKASTTISPIVSLTNVLSSIIVKERESLFDVALRYYGDVSNVIGLVLDNTDIKNVNSRIHGLNMEISPVNENTYVNFYNIYNAKLRTGLDLPMTYGRAFDKSFNFSFN